MPESYKPSLELDPFRELEAQRLRNILMSVQSDLSNATQSINNANTQLPSLLTGRAADALSDALQQQNVRLQNSLSAINTILRGV